MKTIEQLADEYVGHPEEIDEFSSATIKRQAFIDGARAQRKIDIEKACEWLISTEEYPLDADWVSEGIRKAMEEEQ